MCKIIGVIICVIIIYIAAKVDIGISNDAAFLGLCIMLAGFMSGDD